MAKEKASIRPVRWSRTSLLLLALLAMAGIAQATPIVNFGADLEVAPKPIAATVVKTATRDAASAAPAADPTTEVDANSASVTGPSLCALSGTCTKTVKVPEPQSLVLVGSGLLSMAGVLRRKFLR